LDTVHDLTVSTNQGALLHALEHVLACPACQGSLALSFEGAELRCGGCAATYPVIDGIPVFLAGVEIPQEDERRFRDAVSNGCPEGDRQEILAVIARYHCIPVMRRAASAFRAGVRPTEWILDIGVGWGWHWEASGPGAPVLGIDMSLQGLRVARRLLGSESRVVLVCADAGNLPVKPASITGVWSVQTFQHFPDAVLDRVVAGLDRVLRDEFVLQVHNYHRALLHRIAYWLAGRPLPRRSRAGALELRRWTPQEWLAAWHGLHRPSRTQRVGYSELFFHPDLDLKPRRYPLRLERFIAERLPRLAAAIARQAHVRIEGHRAS
jgi:uncharacterized protein YbaR (Trm112 family)